jgi:hypothetical protein
MVMDMPFIWVKVKLTKRAGLPRVATDHCAVTCQGQKAVVGFSYPEQAIAFHEVFGSAATDHCAVT